MTLIDYLNRVHFAENILEEAVWAELDQRGPGPVCLISHADTEGSDLDLRLRGALPRGIGTVSCHATGYLPTESEAWRMAEDYRARGCSMVLAYGAGPVINLAKVVRLLVSHGGPLSRFSEDEGGAVRITGDMPDLIAVPTLRWFPSGFNGLCSVILGDGRMIDIAGRANVPTVTIADPTIVAGEPPDVLAGAGVSAITLCVEALLSPRFNPPASGIALDGLTRGLKSLHPAVADSSIANLREVMAAGMNAAMVQQKGLGMTHAIGSALCSAARNDGMGTGPDKGAIKRLILPEIVAYCARTAPKDCEPLARALGLDNVTDIAPRLAEAFRGLPLPGALKECGVSDEQLQDAAELAARHRALSNSPCRPRADDILAMLRSVF